MNLIIIFFIDQVYMHCRPAELNLLIIFIIFLPKIASISKIMILIIIFDINGETSRIFK